ncbi:MAG: TonB-dependent receptor family protein, partial [Thermoanaerobaculia bacterium]|nr:TonB-dependent receptor family protein [Thermoanaerobaculia bacterium]
MKKFFLSCLLLFFCISLSAQQSPNRVTIKGSIRDTSGAEIPFATVMLLSPKDTTLVNFSRSDDKGHFAFKNVRNAPYLFKISYIGYIPHQQHLDVSPTEINDLGEVAIKPITQELMEVVIKTAKAPLRIRGDTIEYDATTFKVPPGSTVEDLLRRLPGIEVDADGNIKAQGRDVRRVTVDGKTFFGDDPKSATKNLGAETISKVQVYDEKSEQAKLTGVDDGKKEKTMNLELKDEFKKGSFGKITGAIGTEERWAARGNYNRFNDKQQLSFIGYANNINQTGVNWEDYGEFKGQNTFNDRDNGDFGFSSGGGRVYYFSSEDTPLNNFDGRGFTENYGGGANYNFDNKKSKFNLSYFYNETSLDLQQQALRETFLSDNSFTNTDSTIKAEFRGNHSVNTRLEQEIDSNNVFIIKASTRFSKNDAGNRQYQLFYGADEQLTNSLDVNNDSRLNSWRLSSAAIFRHRFKKKGRSFAASAGYNNSQSDGTENLFSLNQFFNASTFTEQIRQLNNNDNSTIQYKSSLLYTEPLSKKWFWESFYNFSQTGNEVNRQVLNPEINNERIDNLSVFYDFNVLYNRLGSSVRYANQGLNISAGLAAQQLRLDGEYSVDKDMPLLTDPINRTFTNLVPNVDMSYQFPNNIWLNLGYGYGVTEPKLQDLQPVPNVNNPAFRTEGNPNLAPERSHSLDLSFNHWNPASLASIGLSGSLNLYDNQIVYNQTIEVIDSVGIRTTTRPDNVSGGNQINGYLWSNFPIIKTKLTMNVNGGINTSQAPSFVNGVENETRNNGYNLRAGLSFTPGQKLILGLNGNIRFNKISYSIQQEQNQNIQNHGLDASLKWQFAGKFFLESNFNYSVYRNDRFGFNQDIPIFNASVRRLLGKNNRLEMRLAAFDILNRRVSISQYGSQNFVMRNVANTLARYYMLSVS